MYGLKQTIDGKTGVKIVRNVPEYNRVVDAEEAGQMLPVIAQGWNGQSCFY